MVKAHCALDSAENFGSPPHRGHFHCCLEEAGDSDKRRARDVSRRNCDKTKKQANKQQQQQTNGAQLKRPGEERMNEQATQSKFDQLRQFRSHPLSTS